MPCNDNLFEDNDASHSPNNAFEATFSQGNRFINNRACDSSYGFWLGFSRENELSGNQISNNRRAGIAAENAFQMKVSGNTLQDNRFGLLIWSKPVPELLQAPPDNDTSKFWRIDHNTIHRNGTGIRIAANQDHGVLPYTPKGNAGSPSNPLRPHDHEILQNVISDNRVGIQSLDADRTIIKDNTFELNLSGDIKS
jgi:parallel beta-helix repeat protein